MTVETCCEADEVALEAPAVVMTVKLPYRLVEQSSVSKITKPYLQLSGLLNPLLILGKCAQGNNYNVGGGGTKM